MSGGDVCGKDILYEVTLFGANNLIVLELGIAGFDPGVEFRSKKPFVEASVA
jgi:hypothetical protein